MNSTVSPEYQGFQEMLEELSSVIAKSQSALLDGKLRELEGCVRRQRTLCEQLESRLRRYSARQNLPCDRDCAHIAVTAMHAREQNRVFSAVLRRMRRNLEVVRNALAGASVEYFGAQAAPRARRI